MELEGSLAFLTAPDVFPACSLKFLLNNAIEKHYQTHYQNVKNTIERHYHSSAYQIICNWPLLFDSDFSQEKGKDSFQ